MNKNNEIIPVIEKVTGESTPSTNAINSVIFRLDKLNINNKKARLVKIIRITLINIEFKTSGFKITSVNRYNEGASCTVITDKNRSLNNMGHRML